MGGFRLSCAKIFYQNKLCKNSKTQKTKSMKLKTLIITTLCTLLLPTMSSFADDTPLGTEMGKINKALKLVNRNLADASKKAENLEKIDVAIKACEESGKLEPEKTKDIPEAEKEKFLTEYKAAMVEMGKHLTDLKAAVEADKADEAKKVLEKLNMGKKEGHKKFQKEE